MKRRSIIFLGIVIAFSLSNCKKDKVEEVAEEEEELKCENEISFSGDIFTVITNTCATTNCHDAGGAANGFVFENHNQISSNASIILSVIRHEAGVTNMPLGGDKLSKEFIDDFYCWIEQGKLDN